MAFNGSTPYALGTPGLYPGRARRQTNLADTMIPNQGSLPDPTARAASLGQRTSALSDTMIPGQTSAANNSVPLTPGLRSNLTNNAVAQARGNALQTAQAAPEYKTGTQQLDDIRAKYGVNDPKLSPEEANLRRTQMFADPEYQRASKMVNATLMPINMAGANAGADMTTALAGAQALTPNFFLNRQLAQDANQRANQANTAEVGLVTANTEQVAPNAASARVVEGSKAGLNNAQAGLVTANTEQVAPNAASARIVEGSKAGLNNAQAKELESGSGRMIAELRTQNQTLTKSHADAQAELRSLRNSYQNLLKMYQGKMGADGGDNLYLNETGGNAPPSTPAAHAGGTGQATTGQSLGPAKEGEIKVVNGKRYRVNRDGSATAVP